MTQKNRKNWMDKANTQENGSVLILALIMASILLSVGMGISNIALKEIKLSSIGNESGAAFYMADTGAECALYWDLRSTTTVDAIDDGSVNDSARYVFSTSSQPGLYVTGLSDIKCFDGTRITTSSWGVPTGISPDRATTIFELKDADLTKPCALVTVEKRDTGGGVFATTIDSRGRSSCDTNSRRVERGLKVSY